LNEPFCLAAYIESFNSRFRDECLPQHWFASLSHMRSIVENWRDDYNHHLPHSTLGYVPPAMFPVLDSPGRAERRPWSTA
jgi:transposase InsO family protein